MAVEPTRRDFLVAAARTTSAFAVVGLPMAAHGLQRTPQPLASPNAPSNQNVPAGMNNYPAGSPDARLSNSFNAVEFRQMIDDLYLMALDLKQESDKTNFKTTMPVDVMPRAQKIEKLAKKIRNQAQG